MPRTGTEIRRRSTTFYNVERRHPHKPSEDFEGLATYEWFADAVAAAEEHADRTGDLVRVVETYGVRWRNF